MRKLPVYLLIDVSGSMYGEPIEAVKSGIQLVHSSLRKDPFALETAYISVISFESSVKQLVPLTEIAQFQPPTTISAGGGTSLGGALAKVAEVADKEVKKSTPSEKGDWKPLVFLMTDGYPTDDVKKGLDKFRKYNWGTVVACAAGDDADVSILQQITENVVKLDVADSGSISAFFQWVSSSVSATSKKIERGSQGVGSIDELPPPPPEISLVNTRS